MDAVFSALADPNRRLVLERLYAEGGQTAKQLSEGLWLSRQGAAKHIALLVEAGLVMSQTARRERLYFLSEAVLLNALRSWIARFDARAVGAEAESPLREPAAKKPRKRDERQNHASKRQKALIRQKQRNREQIRQRESAEYLKKLERFS